MNGAQLFVYQNRTTTKASIYSDAALTVPLANPVQANSSGQFPAIFAERGTVEDPVQYTLSVTGPTGTSIGNPSVFDDYEPSTDVFAAESAALAAGYAEDAANEANAAYADRLLADAAVINAQSSAYIAAQVALAVGYFPAAQANIPRGAVSAAWAAGSGYSNGVYDIVATGGNYSVQPSVRVTVTGGAIASAVVLGRGQYIGASPSTPTVPLAALGAGTGGSVTLTTGFLAQSGQTWWTDGATGQMQLYQNNAGSVAIVTGATLVTTLTSFAADIAELERANPPKTICVMGDSNWQFGTFGSFNGIRLYGNARGILTTARSMNPRYDINSFVDLTKLSYFNGANLGVSGQTSAQMLARFNDLLIQRPYACIIGAPTNDFLQSVNVTTSLNNYKAMVQQALDRGILVICTTVMPVGTGGTNGVPSGDSRRAFVDTWNADIRSWVSDRANVYLFDTAALMVDPAVPMTGGFPRAGWVNSTDQIHITSLAAFSMAPTLNTIINRFVLPRRAYPRFDVANYMPNWNLLGSGGNATAPGVTGTVPDGWRLRHTTGGTSTTCVASAEANGETGGQSVVLTFTLGGAATNEVFDFRRATDTISTSALVGKWVVMAAEVELNGTAFRGVQMINDPFGDGNIESLSADTVGTINRRLYLITPPYLFGSVSADTTIQPNVSFVLNPAGSGTQIAKVHKIGLFEVTDPRIARFLA